VKPSFSSAVKDLTYFEKMIYVDNNATTPMPPEVFEAMRPYFGERFGNPSSLHRAGQECKRAVDRARETVADFLGADGDSEIIFTSGGTEANHAAIHGALKASTRRRSVITTKVEHLSVLNVFKGLEQEGYGVTYVNVDEKGHLDLDGLRAHLSADTALVSVMHANNETGVLFPMDEIGREVKGWGAFFHVDAVQSIGKVPVRLRDTSIDLLSLAGHKFHGPKGVGALFLRRGTPWSPTFLGGAQERKRRAGTENVAGIVGLAEACTLAASGLAGRNERIAFLRDKLENSLLSAIPGVQINGDRTRRVSNTSNLSFQGVDSESMLIALSEEGICASSGSACTTGAVELSHVLTAMGLSEDRVRSALRFSLSVYNTERDIDAVIEKMISVTGHLRTLAESEV
jgi:cysteine desulfurase